MTELHLQRLKEKELSVSRDMARAEEPRVRLPSVQEEALQDVMAQKGKLLQENAEDPLRVQQDLRDRQVKDLQQDPLPQAKEER